MAGTSRNALAPSTEVGGYIIETVLGTGGFGVTYRARELLLGRTVAIKEYLPSGISVREVDGMSISPNGSSEEESFNWGMERFRTEAQTLVEFRHPNIVTVFNYFETNGTGYLVMEYVEGRTLGQLLSPNKALEESEIHEIIDELLDGLEAVHEKRFLHRDIKPANIFIRADGSPVLIDFGAARQALGQHSKSLTSIVSAGYAPFEQYDSAANQGPWTDIYALGGVLYRCVTGTRPPDATSRITALVSQQPDPLAPVRGAAKVACSDPLLNAIDQALAVRESDRPQSVAALKLILAGNEAPAAPASNVHQRLSEAMETSGSTETMIANADRTVPSPKASSDRQDARPAHRRWSVPLAAAIIGGAVIGVWQVGFSGDSRECVQLGQQTRSAIAASDLAKARRYLNTAVSKDCSTKLLTTLKGETVALTVRFKTKEAGRKAAAEAARKQEEEKTKAERRAKPSWYSARSGRGVIRFAAGDSTLTPSATRVIRSLAAKIRANQSEWQVTIYCSSDRKEIASKAKRRGLSRSRCSRLASYLRSQGISNASFTAVVVKTGLGSIFRRAVLVLTPRKQKPNADDKKSTETAKPNAKTPTTKKLNLVGRTLRYDVDVIGHTAVLTSKMSVRLLAGGRAIISGCKGNLSMGPGTPDSCILSNGSGRWRFAGVQLCISARSRTLCFTVRPRGDRFSVGAHNGNVKYSWIR